MAIKHLTTSIRFRACSFRKLGELVKCSTVDDLHPGEAAKLSGVDKTGTAYRKFQYLVFCLKCLINDFDSQKLTNHPS